MHDIDRLHGRQEADAGAVVEEAQVPVIGDDQDGTVPGGLRGRGGAGADVVHCADVAAGEAEAGAGVVHCFVGWVGWR